MARLLLKKIKDVRGVKFALRFVAVGMILGGCAFAHEVGGNKPIPTPLTVERNQAEILFSPEDDIQSAWIREINKARKYIHLACFGISNPVIAHALESARSRGVEVILLEDNRQSRLRWDEHEVLQSDGCEVIIKKSTVLLHDKMGVFDGKDAIIGSWNLSESAEKQDNSDVVFINDPSVAQQTEKAWEWMFQRERGAPYRFGAAPSSIPASSAGVSAPVPPPSNGSSTLVWVNTRSGVYHYPGSRWYGKTSQGAYMTEKEAISKGYRAAKNGD